jgi:hypothetical protein
MANTGKRRRTNDVQIVLPSRVTECELRDILNMINKGEDGFIKMSWRTIGDSLGINYATLNAYANGRSIVNKEHRRILGVVPCGTRYNYRHITIRADDPESAYRSMERLAPGLLDKLCMIRERMNDGKRA